MAESHLQLNADGTTATRKTTLWPISKSLQQEIIKSIFEQQNWHVTSISNINGSHWKIETACGNFSRKVNLYISSIRDESRQPDEFKMQLGNTYPEREEDGWVNLVLGIYTVDDGVSPVEYILSGYDIDRYDFSTNPSIRGTRTSGLQKAKVFGMFATDKSVLFRPEFLYYYIETQAGKHLQDGIENSEEQNDEKHILLSGDFENQPESTENISTFYRPYITAIKSKPFLLLAGISGTGKSRIVRELARACWDAGSEEYEAQKPRNFEMVQVKPNWHDSSELIGYVSRIDGEKFVVGPFLKFLVKAINDPEHPYFLCLDEMNLAPVEQYFAEYLSVVESRKVNEDGEVITDPIIDYEATEAYHSLIDQLFPGDLENRKAYLTEEGGKRLTIPKNLIVVGTVNMDETTFSFSRKVLDRAMTIEMNEVDLRGGLTERHEQIGKLGNAELVGNAVEGVDVYEAHKDVCDMVIEYLEAVNGKLEGTPFKIAYRTRNEFLLYVVNNLPYNKDEEDNDLDQNYVIARALDEITSMKILSRIEGDETKVSKDFLTELGKTIKTKLEEISGYQYEKEETEEAYGSTSLAKLHEMKEKVESGYTSFWS